MNKNNILSFSSNLEHYDMLYMYAAILENMGYTTLVPINIQKILLNSNIYNERLKSRNMCSLDDMRHKRIDLSDILIVYIDGKDSTIIDEYLLSDLKYAIDNHKDIWIGYDHINPIDIKANIGFTLGVKNIIMRNDKHIDLNGGYYIHLRELEILEYDEE